MINTINRNLLKYAASTAIFCPHCQTVMDMRQTVVITLGDDTITCCTTCFDKGKASVYAFAKETSTPLDVVDGREMFASTRAKAIVMCMCGARATFPSQRAANKAGWYLKNSNADPAHEEAIYDRCPQCGLSDGAKGAK